MRASDEGGVLFSNLGTGNPCQLHATASRAYLLRSLINFSPSPPPLPPPAISMVNKPPLLPPFANVRKFSSADKTSPPSSLSSKPPPASSSRGAGPPCSPERWPLGTTRQRVGFPLKIFDQTRFKTLSSISGGDRGVVWSICGQVDDARRRSGFASLVCKRCAFLIANKAPPPSSNKNLVVKPRQPRQWE